MRFHRLGVLVFGTLAVLSAFVAIRVTAIKGNGSTPTSKDGEQSWLIINGERVMPPWKGSVVNGIQYINGHAFLGQQLTTDKIRTSPSRQLEGDDSISSALKAVCED